MCGRERLEGIYATRIAKRGRKRYRVVADVRADVEQHTASLKQFVEMMGLPVVFVAEPEEVGLNKVRWIEPPPLTATGDLEVGIDVGFEHPPKHRMNPPLASMMHSGTIKLEDSEEGRASGSDGSRIALRVLRSRHHYYDTPASPAGPQGHVRSYGDLKIGDDLSDVKFREHMGGR